MFKQINNQYHLFPIALDISLDTTTIQLEPMGDITSKEVEPSIKAQDVGGLQDPAHATKRVKARQSLALSKASSNMVRILAL